MHRAWAEPEKRRTCQSEGVESDDARVLSHLRLLSYATCCRLGRSMCPWPGAYGRQDGRVERNPFEFRVQHSGHAHKASSVRRQFIKSDGLDLAATNPLLTIGCHPGEIGCCPLHRFG